MDFRTKVDIADFGFKINHGHSCIFTGSCFAENVGAKMKNSKIKTLINPTGIHYNPISLAKSIEMALSANPISAADLFYANGVWNHFNFHSQFSGYTEEETCAKMTVALKAFATTLKKTNFLFVTFGTSFVYELSETGSVVTNCHKIAEKNFNRRFVNPAETIEVWNQTIQKLKTVNPKLKIIFTVSPIRHFRDGATNNLFSKSALLLAIRELTEKDTGHCVYYFPAYEMWMDELRDYRFFADDMLHPSNVAINYIWERFSEVFFSKTTSELNNKIDTIIFASHHRVFNPNTTEHVLFCKNMISKIENLVKEYPELDFSEEERFFRLG